MSFDKSSKPPGFNTDLIQDAHNAEEMAATAPPEEMHVDALRFETLPDDQSLWDEIDQVLREESIFTVSTEDAAAPFDQPDLYQEMQDTLVALTAQSLGPIDRYMKALSQGEDSRDVLEICEIIVSSLIPKLETAHLREHLEELMFFRSLLLLTLAEKDQHALEKLKEILIEAFAAVRALFKLKYRGSRTAVKNLAYFYASMKANPRILSEDIRRVFAIGVPSLTWLRRTSIEELASLSGLSPKRLADIKKVANTYFTRSTGAIYLGRNFRVSTDYVPRISPATFGSEFPSEEDVKEKS